MLKNKKKTIGHALKALGYKRWHDGEYSEPYIEVNEAIDAICDYLKINLCKSTGVIARKRLPTRAKKEKK